MQIRQFANCFNWIKEKIQKITRSNGLQHPLQYANSKKETNKTKSVRLPFFNDHFSALFLIKLKGRL